MREQRTSMKTLRVYLLIQRIFVKFSQKVILFCRKRLTIWYVSAIIICVARATGTTEYADVAELADALDSGSSSLKRVWVQIPSSAPKACDRKDVTGFFLCCIVENWRFRQLIFELLFIKMSSGFQTVGHFYCLIFPQNSELRQGRGQFFLRKTE